MSINELAAYSLIGEHQPADIAGKLYRDDKGDLRFGFGKNQHRRVLDEPGYVAWMMDARFPGSTLDVLREEMERQR